MSTGVLVGRTQLYLTNKMRNRTNENWRSLSKKTFNKNEGILWESLKKVFYKYVLLF